MMTLENTDPQFFTRKKIDHEHLGVGMVPSRTHKLCEYAGLEATGS